MAPLLATAAASRSFSALSVSGCGAAKRPRCVAARLARGARGVAVAAEAKNVITLAVSGMMCGARPRPGPSPQVSRPDVPARPPAGRPPRCEGCVSSVSDAVEEAAGDLFAGVDIDLAAGIVVLSLAQPPPEELRAAIAKAIEDKNFEVSDPPQ